MSVEDVAFADPSFNLLFAKRTRLYGGHGATRHACQMLIWTIANCNVLLVAIAKSILMHTKYMVKVIG